MKKLVFSIALAVAAAGISASARAAEPGDSIRQLNQSFVKAWNAHDPKMMAAVWAEDGSLINPFGEKCSNRAEAEKLFEKEQSGVMKASTFKIDSFALRRLDDNVVMGDWEATLTGMVDPGGKPLPPWSNHVTALYQKRGGKWTVVAARAFQVLPPPGAPAK